MNAVERAGRTMARWWAPTRMMWRRLADPLPVTPLGALTALAATWGLRRFGFEEMDVVLLVVGYVALSLVAASALLVTALGLFLKLRLSAPAPDETLRAETGQRTPTSYSMAALRWLPLVRIRWHWDRPQGVAVHGECRLGRLHEEVTFHQRGETRGVRRRIVVEDALGLARVAFRQDDPILIEALPHVGGLRKMNVLSSLAGGDERPHPMGLDDGDRVDLRRYVPGDPARFIHWKLFGRTRKLMVRIPERALCVARRTVGYLIAGEGDEATAAAARVAIEEGALGTDWVFGADGATRDASTPSEAIELVIGSATARHRDPDRAGASLASFVIRAERTGPASLIVFAPPTPGPWIERLLAVARARAQPLRVVIGVDGVRTAPGPSLARRILTRRSLDSRVSGQALASVLDVLRARRCEVVLLDRPSGRLLGPGHLDRPRGLHEAAA